MISISGHSGCRLDILHKKNKPVLRKSSFSKEYSPRLANQAAKQAMFEPTSHIISPNILASGYQSEKYWFEMDYIHGYDFFSFVERAGPKELDHFWNSLKSLLLKQMLESRLLPYPREKFVDKSKAVSAGIKTRDKTIDEALSYINNFSTDKKILIGPCHGDLTFSNMVVSKDFLKIYLIDFLDSFCSTPIQDVVKIRQDTVHKWTLRKCTGTFDTVKVDLALRYLDQKVVSFINSNAVISHFYKLVQLMSLLRILVYTADENTYNYLIKCLEYELQNEFNTAHCR
tara:strand:+ start:52 stop:909 length:858 start_codon:yes stop_codon:yes gene_type:complete